MGDDCESLFRLLHPARLNFEILQQDGLSDPNKSDIAYERRANGIAANKPGHASLIRRHGSSVIFSRQVAQQASLQHIDWKLELKFKREDEISAIEVANPILNDFWIVGSIDRIGAVFSVKKASAVSKTLPANTLAESEVSESPRRRDMLRSLSWRLRRFPIASLPLLRS